MKKLLAILTCKKYSTRELRKERNDKINRENIHYIKTHTQDLPSQKWRKSKWLREQSKWRSQWGGASTMAECNRSSLHGCCSGGREFVTRLYVSFRLSKVTAYLVSLYVPPHLCGWRCLENNFSIRLANKCPLMLILMNFWDVCQTEKGEGEDKIILFHIKINELAKNWEN
jgi:hypothetical protein